MTLLIIGTILMIAAHLFAHVAPGARAALDARFGTWGARVVPGVVALLALVLMVIGFRAAPFVALYTPLPGMGHANNLLMLFAFAIFGAGMSKGVIWTRIRFPFETGILIWAGAHLLVNGDLASLILFGGMALWAVLSILLKRARAGAWARPASGGWRRDAVMLAIALVCYALTAWVHFHLGHSPFLGSYA